MDDERNGAGGNEVWQNREGAGIEIGKEKARERSKEEGGEIKART